MSDGTLALIEARLTEISDALEPGSPAYVRRKRDEAAVAALPVFMEKPQYSRSEQVAAGILAVEQANALITALGYTVPGEEGEDE